MSTSMWSKFLKGDKESAAREVEEEKRAAMRKADERLVKWYARHHPGSTSKAAPGSWSTSGASPAGSILPPRPTSPAKFDFSAWEFNVACIKLAEKLGFTTPAEIYAFIKEIERD